MPKAEARIIAYLGKGGAGKTVLSALTGRLLMSGPKCRLLLVDADPSQGLSLALGLPRPATLSQVREKVIHQARNAAAPETKEELAAAVDYLLMAALQDQAGFSLLVMGRNEGPGCFCPANTLLRESIEDLACNFDWVVIDAEAGLEQVSRQVTRRVDYPIVVSDASCRGLTTAAEIAELNLRLTGRPAAGLILNRISSDTALSRNSLPSSPPLLGTIPEDELITRFDAEGHSLLDLPSTSSAILALREIFARAGIQGS